MRKIFFSKKAFYDYMHQVEEKKVDGHCGVCFEYFRLLPVLPIYILTDVHAVHFKD